MSWASSSALPRPVLPAVDLTVRIAFNPNVTTAWFTSVMGIINNVTMLAIIMAGAAVVREREHGTMDQLLVMLALPSICFFPRRSASSSAPLPAQCPNSGCS